MAEKTVSFSELDRYLFHEGSHFKAYKKMGAHIRRENGVSGVRFCIWAPEAKRVCVLCDRLGWDEFKGEMERVGSGVWEVFIPGIRASDKYRYMIVGCDGITRFKADPYAFRSELRPATASIVCPLTGYKWNDREFITQNTNKNVLQKPMAIYEVHLGSWKRDMRYEDGFLNYRVLADELAQYINYMGYTHVELIGICEYPFDGSWGYQVTGFFSPTSRYGTPNDFRYFVDKMHQCGIGVILDWVPAHFPKDSFGLEKLDGGATYEALNPLLAEYPEWGTKAFDHSKGGVRSFLLSSAYYWVTEFHIDALRVDAVASMLHTSFGRSQWYVNEDGSTHNHASIAFLKMVNKTITKKTRAYLIAEDSSIEPGITEEVDKGGMGFMFKWNMGWMNDTLKYIETDPIYRHWDHGKLTHTANYAFLENFVLVLSHDEVVHLKKPMVKKAPGSIMDQMGTLKSLYAFQFTHPGKKLLFMGQDFGEDREWDENRELNWGLTQDFGHRDIMQCVKNLLGIYRSYPVLHTDSKNPTTFEWINSMDYDRNIISYVRRNPWNYDNALLVVCSFSPMQYNGYRCGVPLEGYYKRIFSTYDSLPGSGGPGEVADIPPLCTLHEECDGREYCVSYDLRPFESAIFEFPIKKTEE
ncbi:MAG: 1,4-alpha-glucan branching protein GlgB [Oscillospiraceae bacterium]|nr:1,4-alpha-glucan branching protein GlgB [Oscillospiraceae bacterium]